MCLVERADVRQAKSGTGTNNGKIVIGYFDGGGGPPNRGQRVMDEENKGTSRTHPGFYMYGSMDNAA